MLTYPNGRRIDEPWIGLRRVEDLPLEFGWNRHFELRSILSHDDRYFVHPGTHELRRNLRHGVERFKADAKVSTRLASAAT
jgi:hypothetical protein